MDEDSVEVQVGGERERHMSWFEGVEGGEIIQ